MDKVDDAKRKGAILPSLCTHKHVRMHTRCDYPHARTPRNHKSRLNGHTHLRAWSHGRKGVRRRARTCWRSPKVVVSQLRCDTQQEKRLSFHLLSVRLLLVLLCSFSVFFVIFIAGNDFGGTDYRHFCLRSFQEIREVNSFHKPSKLIPTVFSVRVAMLLHPAIT